jgi:AhpD family alkylhydroperoxidase
VSDRVGRIPDGGFRELGPINWLINKIAASAIRAPQMHVFTTLGQHKRLFWGWLIYGWVLLWAGRLPRPDTELVILRVAHLRGCEYELQQHRWLARRYGLDAELQEKVFLWPDITGLSPRRQALLNATDEFVNKRSISRDTWDALSRYLDRRQLIEFCMLAGQYDALAATITTLEIPLDFPR